MVRGSTTEIYIYPEESKYSNRDFLWRISSATIEDEETIFTSLPDYERYIMVLNGQIVLEHKGYYRINLKPFERDWFLGEWETKCKGKAKDFNLMLKKGLKGSISHFEIKDEIYSEKINWNISDKFKRETKIFYSLENGFSVEFNNYQYSLKVGDALLITAENTFGESSISFFSTSTTKVIKAQILY